MPRNPATLADVCVTISQPGCCTRVVLPFTQLEERGRNLIIPCKDFAAILCLQPVLWKQGRILHYCPGSWLSLSRMSTWRFVLPPGPGRLHQMQGSLQSHLYLVKEFRAFATELCKSDWELPQFSQQLEMWWVKGLKAPGMLHFAPASSFVWDFREFSQ